MQIINGHLHEWDKTLACLLLPVDRLTLARRRWRGKATDGAEFGFDLEHPLGNRDIFHQSDTAYYRIAQQPEPVLELRWSTPTEAARAGWLIGNLHFQIAIGAQKILAPDDPAVRQMLDRERIGYRAADDIFEPLGGSHAHGHAAH